MGRVNLARWCKGVHWLLSKATTEAPPATKSMALPRFPTAMATIRGVNPHPAMGTSRRERVGGGGQGYEKEGLAAAGGGRGGTGVHPPHPHHHLLLLLHPEGTC